MKIKRWRYALAAIAVLLAFVASVGAYLTDSSVYNPPNYNSFIPPNAGSTYVDPVFGTAIQRITNAMSMPNADGGGYLPWIEPEYPTASPFNVDNTRLILVCQSYFGLFDGQGNFIQSLPIEINASSEPRWSRKDANTLYYHYNNQLKSRNVSTGVTSVVHTFTEYSSIKGAGEMDMSFDGDHMVLIGNNTSVFEYTISTDTKGPAFSTGSNGYDSVYIAPNNYVTITWNAAGTGRYQGVELFDQNMVFQRQLTHAGGHMHMSQDLNGDAVLIWTNSADPQPVCGQNAIVKVRLKDGAQTCLLSLDWSLAVHITAADNTWAFVETYAPGNPSPGTSAWVPYANELLQIKLDGSEVRRLAHHRSRPYDSYNYQPKMTASHDGSHLAFASNMDLQGILGYPQLYADSYMILTGVTVPVGVMGSSTTTAPANTSAPVISGTAQQGSALTASTGSWSGSPTSYGYQWYRCSSTGASCGVISGATGSSYLLGSGDAGYTLYVQVTATNSAGSGTAKSALTPVIQAATVTAPSNTSAPAISGVAQQGQTLSASTGTWSGSPTSYTFQWQRCSSAGCANVSGANSQTYLLGSADVSSTMRVSVTALNTAGSATALSAQTAVVQAGTTTGSSSSTIALIQSAAAQGSAVSSVTAAFSGANTAGNMIIAFVRMSGTTQTVSISDTQGNNYSKAVSAVQTTDGHQSYIFYASNIRTGTNTITALFSGSNNHPWLAVYEYSGVTQLDKTAGTQGYGTVASSGATASTASANELVFAGVGLPASFTSSIAAGSGYSLLQQNVYPSGTSPAGDENMAASATGSFTGSFTLSAAANWTALVATFSGPSAPTAAPTVTTTSLPAGTVSAAYSATLAASGGTAPYSWSLASGALPAGLSLSTGGTISGSPTTAVTSSFTVQVKDANAQTASAALSITINPATATLSVTTLSLPGGTVGSVYSASLAATGGTAPYSWSLASGALPAGLTLSSSGTISGTPTTAGTASFTVQVKDAGANTASKALSIAISAPVTTGSGIALVQSTSAQGTGGHSLSQAFAAPNTAGNMVIVFVRMSSTNQTVSVSDSAGNTYAEAVSQVQTADGHQVHLFYAPRVRGGANTVTVRFSASNNHPWLAIYEYSGVSALDQTAHAQGQSTSPYSGLTGATTAASELVFAAAGLPSSANAATTAGSGYKLEQFDNVGYGSQAANEDRIASATGQFAGSFSLSSAQNWTCVVATFK